MYQEFVELILWPIDLLFSCLSPPTLIMAILRNRHTFISYSHRNKITLQQSNSVARIWTFKGGINLEKGRKTRSDKKRAVAAPIDSQTHDTISRLGYVLDLPLKTVGHVLSLEGYRSHRMIDTLKKHFKRNLAYENRYIFADPQPRPYKPMERGCYRLHMRFTEQEHDPLASLAYALDGSVGAATSLLIRTALTYKEIMYPILARYIQSSLDSRRREQLKKVCRHLDSKSEEHHITMPMILAHVLERSLEEERKISYTLSQLDHFS